MSGPSSITISSAEGPFEKTLKRALEVGDHVEKGQVVCIVEAMKMMNEIKSDFSGTIKSINVEDGTPVEFDQNLITVS